MASNLHEVGGLVELNTEGGGALGGWGITTCVEAGELGVFTAIPTRDLAASERALGFWTPRLRTWPSMLWIEPSEEN